MFVWMENAAFCAGEYAGAEMWKPHCGRPRLRQRDKSGSRTAASLDSLLLIRGKVPLNQHGNNRHSELPYPSIATLGYTERPDRLQFMAGQVGLYSTKFSCFARQQVEPAQPASRPQAARKMWKRHCRRVATREAVWPWALPAYWLRTRRPQLKCSR